MKAERWQKVKEIFNQAVEIPVAGRSDFLREICREETELRSEIEQMLVFADDDEQEDSFEKNVFEVIDEKHPLPLPEKIGVYKVVRELGRGGMGVVYQAVRETKDFRQKVALKVIKRGMDTDAILSRFRHEQQILATLEHPNIARFLDGGMTDDGLAFYAMEFVEGEFIDDYCRQKELSLNDRLRLFREVCAAVQFAHQNLIIHRDLKPSNILVTRDGTPKLLDFGISKILASDASENPGTATALGMMTPAYASPEQIRGERVNTATDIYSLGVILFEILTGQKPYKFNSTNQYELQKIICESDPLRPSAVRSEQRAVSGEQWRGDNGQWSVVGGQQKAEESEQRVAESERRAVSSEQGEEKKTLTTGDTGLETNPKSKIQNLKFLRGDLDNILLKALQKEPARRYSSVGQFSEDIRRHLEGLPIIARPATVAYRAAKFVKRNKISVTAGAIVFLSLCIGIGVALRQTYRAEQQRILAEKRFSETRQIANNVVFKYTDAITNLPNSSQVRAMLLQDASAYLDNLAHDAEGDFELQRELATAYRKLGDIQGKPHTVSIGDTKGAIESYEKAAVLMESIYRTSTEDKRTVEAATNLLDIYRQLTVTLSRAADTSEKRAEYNEKKRVLIEEMLEKYPNDFRFRLERAQMEIGKAGNLMKTNFGEGEAYYESHILPVVAEIEQGDQSKEPAVERFTTRVYNELGWRYSERGKYQIELDADRRKAAGFFSKGLEFARRELENYKARYAQDAQSREKKRSLSVGYINFGIALRNLERFDESFEYLKKGYEIKREIEQFDQNDVQAVFDLGTILSEIGLWHYERKDYQQAITEFEKSLAEFDHVIAADEDHHEAIYYKTDVLVQMANAYAKAGNLGKSLKFYRDAETVSEKSTAEYAEQQIQFARIFLHRGRTYMEFAEKSRSPELWKKAQSELEKALDNVKKADSKAIILQIEITEKQLEKCRKMVVSGSDA